MFYGSPARLLICLLLTCCCGCGESGPQRATVTGNVTLDGAPLDKGNISFSPLAEGPSASAEIVNGRYEIPEEFGPGAGKYRVEISSWRPSGKAVMNEESGKQEPVLVAAIPPQYNTKSKLEVTVQEGEPNTFDFPLTTKLTTK